MPLELQFGNQDLEQSEAPRCPSEYVEWMRAAHQEAGRYARGQPLRTHLKLKRVHDAKAAFRRFPSSTCVLYYYVPKARKKLGLAWTGPYLVIEAKLGWMVKIQREPHGEIKEVHIDHLKQCPYPVDTEPLVKSGEKKGTDESEDEDPAEMEEGAEEVGNVSVIGRTPRGPQKPTQIGHQTCRKVTKLEAKVARDHYPGPVGRSHGGDADHQTGWETGSPASSRGMSVMAWTVHPERRSPSAPHLQSSQRW